MVVAAMIAALIVGGALGYWLHWRITPPPPELTCRDERGGRVCFTWARPPTEPFEATATGDTGTAAAAGNQAYDSQ